MSANVLQRSATFQCRSYKQPSKPSCLDGMSGYLIGRKAAPRGPWSINILPSDRMAKAHPQVPRVDWRVCVAVSGGGEGGLGHPTRLINSPSSPKNPGSASLAVATDKQQLSMVTATLHSPNP